MVFKVRGLFLIKNFFSPALNAETLTHVHEMHQRVRAAAIEAIEIQARSYLSRQHNLQTKESFRKVTIISPEEKKKLNLQYFEVYGEKGHELIYGIGAENISEFILQRVLPSINRLALIQTMRGTSSLELRQATNIYTPTPELPKSVPGFGFHKDAPENGEITAIWTLVGNSAVFEMRNEKNLEERVSLKLEEGSLVILSDEARWNWLHRVVRDTHSTKQRISIVFGLKPRISLKYRWIYRFFYRMNL